MVSKEGSDIMENDNDFSEEFDDFDSYEEDDREVLETETLSFSKFFDSKEEAEEWFKTKKALYPDYEVEENIWEGGTRFDAWLDFSKVIYAT